MRPTGKTHSGPRSPQPDLLLICQPSHTAFLDKTAMRELRRPSSYGFWR